MSWNDERSKSGKQPFQWIELEVDRCSLNFGETPCAAVLGVTGEQQCLNSWATCQDNENFTPASFWFRFAEPVADIPRQFAFDPADDGLDTFLPLLVSVKHSPGLPNPGESLGMRTVLEVTLTDAPHHDRGIDKYINSRNYDAMRQGSFLRKLRSRWPHYIGRRLRWYQGYITNNTTLSEFRRREYVIERFEGPDANGHVKIVAKDVLKLLDDDRAQAPRKSVGELVLAMTDAQTVTYIDVATSDITEYDIDISDDVDYVRIGGEIFSYTGTEASGSPANSVKLTGVTRGAPAPYTTAAESHNAGDAVQRCRYFSGTIPQVVRQLMVTYGELDPAFIPFTDWETEALTWLAGDDVQRLVTDPEGVRSLVNEIISSTLTWGFWFDEIDQEIKFRAVRPVDVDDVVIDISDDANIVADSIKVTDTPDYVRNEVQVLYGQINPTGKRDDIENYRRGLAVIDADSQSANEIGQRRIHKVYSRWHPSSSSAVVLRFARRTLSARVRNLMSVEFQLERKDEDIRTAQFADLTTLFVIDEFGVPKTTRVQVMRVNAQGENLSYRAREDFFKPLAFGRWAPGALSGLRYWQATDAQRERYIFWAPGGGVESTNGNAGKSWA